MVSFKPREHAIRADLGLLKEARDFAERVAAEFGFNEDARYQVKLAMSEAVTNAIQHGSSSSSDPIRILAAPRSRRPRLRGARHGPLPAARARRGAVPESAAAGSSSCGC